MQDKQNSDKESSKGMPVLSSEMEIGKRTVNNHWDSSEDDVIITGDKESPIMCR